MIAIGTLIQKNSIVKRLIAEGDISLVQLKRIYRRLCKMTHPDLKKEDGAGFIRLKEEYEEALAHIDALKMHLSGYAEGSGLGEADIRRMFYDALRHYLAAGLSSARMRIKTDVKARNELILREVVYWANLYKPSFIPVFLDYNKTYLRRFTEWDRRDNLGQAQKLLVRALYNTTDYESSKSPQALRAVRSYLSDCFEYLEILAPSVAVKALRAIAAWFSGEIEALALLRKQRRETQPPEKPPVTPEEKTPKAPAETSVAPRRSEQTDKLPVETPAGHEQKDGAADSRKEPPATAEAEPTGGGDLTDETREASPPAGNAGNADEAGNEPAAGQGGDQQPEPDEAKMPDEASEGGNG